MLRISTAVITSAVLALFGFASAGKAEGVKVGDKAPQFEMKGTDGKIYKLSDFKGKQAVVIAWYPKAKTGGCTAECKSFAANSDALKATGAAYFTASCDTVEYNGEFAKDVKADYPILSDPNKNVAKAYGVVHANRQVPERWTFYIDKEGVVREIDKKINTKQAGEDAVAKIKALGLAQTK